MSEHSYKWTISAAMAICILAGLMCGKISYAAAQYNFAFMADSRSPNESGTYNRQAMEKLLNRINALPPNRKPEFVFFGGDVARTCKGEHDNNFSDWFHTVRAKLNIPIMVVRGNHELNRWYSGKNPVTEKNAGCQKAFGDYFNKKLPDGSVFLESPDGYSGRTFSFEYQNAQFVVLDFYQYPHNGMNPSMNGYVEDNVLIWLEDIFSRKNKSDKSQRRHKFVFAHAPFFSPVQDPSLEKLKKLMAKYKVTAYMVGHDHIYAWQQQRVDGESAGINQIVSGNAGACDPPESCPSVRGDYRFTARKLNFVIVEVSGTNVVTRAFDESGSCFHQVTFKTDDAHKTAFGSDYTEIKAVNSCSN